MWQSRQWLAYYPAVMRAAQLRGSLVHRARTRADDPYLRNRKRTRV